MITHDRSRVSGPLRDRFDVQVEMPVVPIADLRQGADGEWSEIVATLAAAASG